MVALEKGLSQPFVVMKHEIHYGLWLDTRVRPIIYYQSNSLHRFKRVDVPWCQHPLHMKLLYVFTNTNYKIHFISYIKFKRLSSDICITLLYVLSRLHFISYDFHILKIIFQIINFGLIIFIPPISTQQTEVRHFLPYKAFYGVIFIVA